MWDNAIEQNNQNTMSDTVIKYNKNMLQFEINVTAGVTVWRVWSGIHTYIKRELQYKSRR